MLIDLEGNKIEMVLKENPHIQVFGRAGFGKSYTCCRMIEAMCSEMPVVVVDYSGSYTEDELQKSNLSVSEDMMKVYDPDKEHIQIACGETQEDMVATIADAILVMVESDSQLQRDLLETVSKTIIGTEVYITFPRILAELKSMLENEEQPKYRENINFLISKLNLMGDVKDVELIQGIADFENGVHILQFSNYSIKVGSKLAQLFLESFWIVEQKVKKKKRIQFILDEFQRLRLADTAAEHMIREGRRYKIGMTMLTQFPPASEKELEILDQAATSLFFSPTSKALNRTAAMIDLENKKEWKVILKKLPRGTCVLKGTYLVNDCREGTNPIICKVVSNSQS